MMRILERYITKTMLLSTGLITVIMTSVLFILSLLTELKNVGQGDYGMPQALYVVLLRMPSEIYHFFPILILIGSIVALTLLSSSRELAVMRASGFSLYRVIYCVLTTALALTIFVAVISEWLGPRLNYVANISKENARNASVAVVTASGVWLHIENNFIHIENVIGKELLQGVTRYQFDNAHHLQAAYYAKLMSYDHNDWQMHDVLRTTFASDRTKSESFKTFPWQLKFNSNLLNLALVIPKDLSLPKLAKFTEYLKKNGLQSSQYEYEFWQRIFQPIASLIMIFLAIPFVLSTFSTSTLGWRIMVGILMGFGFFILNALLGQLCIVYQMPAVFAALLPIALFALFGFILTRQLIRQ